MLIISFARRTNKMSVRLLSVARRDGRSASNGNHHQLGDDVARLDVKVDAVKLASHSLYPLPRLSSATAKINLNFKLAREE